jgi:hypothetical protein
LNEEFSPLLPEHVDRKLIFVQGKTMGRLWFVCPASEREVDTGIELDPVSFASLCGEELRCPDCLGVHQIAQIKV